MAGGGSPRRRHRLRGRQLEPLDPLEESSIRLWECLPAVDGRRDQIVLLRRPARAVSGIHEMASAVSGIHEMASAVSGIHEMASARRTRGRVVHVMGALISVHPVAAAAPRRRAGRPVTRRAGRPATRWLAADAAAPDELMLLPAPCGPLALLLLLLLLPTKSLGGESDLGREDAAGIAGAWPSLALSAATSALSLSFSSFTAAVRAVGGIGGGAPSPNQLMVTT
jgi:hypothetical protein